MAVRSNGSIFGSGFGDTDGGSSIHFVARLSGKGRIKIEV
jgi:hypothetical protein